MIKLRINPKAFALANDSTPVEVQEFDGRKIEIFNLNEFEGLKDEFVMKGKFAVWSSEDGVNYRLYIEEGYHNKLKELYSQSVNKIWVDFWDVCEKITSNMSKRVIVPLTVVSVLICLSTMFIKNQEVSTYIMLAVIVISLVGMIFINRLSKKKIYDENARSVDLIKKHLGSKKFEKLLDDQKDYMDAYFDALYPEDEEESLEETEEKKDIE